MTHPSITDTLYRPSLALLTDLYQLTMAYGYWRARPDTEACFQLFFRSPPFGSGFTIACGLAPALEFVERFRFLDEDLAYLATLRGHDERALFDPEFLDHLRAMRLEVSIDAVPEGTVVFAREPLLCVRGPIEQCQLLESALLNLVNFQTLIATKAARVCLAARGEPVIEFGLRRAQGIDGSLAASRAAFIGGCTATSNVLAGRLHGIPVRGTHAHSWVMAFDDEEQAFRAYAAAMPNNCVFLVDTYDTLDGVRRAVRVGHELRARGQRLLGVRLDSGDLAYLSIEARKILDEAGFADAVILASNDLDEHIITSLKQQGATIAMWGVGTRLVTAYDQPALGGVYKLAATRAAGGPWKDRIKLAEQLQKVNIPGLLQVRRYVEAGRAVADAIHDTRHPVPDPCTIIDPLDPTRRKVITAGTPHEDLLTPAMRGGRRVDTRETLGSIQARVHAQLARFHPGVKRFVNPHEYPVGLERGLHERRTALILEARAEPM